ncbi:MAG TPA: pseudaminic acid synthase [Longimicrobiales bacterium]
MTVRIGARDVGPAHPAFIIAEISANHNGDLDRALDCIHAAAEAGADAVKFQTYTPDTITIDAAGPDFVIPPGGPWGGKTLYQLYGEAHTPWDWHGKLFEAARSRGLVAFSTPFDASAVRLLESLHAPAYKIASFELVDDGLLAAVAETGKPVLLSTGMASLEEIDHAVRTLRGAGAGGIIVLRCTSSYPAPDSSMNLATIPALASVLECPVGLSDHSLGVTAAVVAVTLGACVVEKHLTLSRADGGVDAHFSLEPDEFRQMVAEVRRAEAMRGRVSFGPGVAEKGNKVFRRSLYVVKDVAEGEPFTPDNVRSIRPGFGLAPRFLEVVIGKRATKALPRGTALQWEHIGGPENG